MFTAQSSRMPIRQIGHKGTKKYAHTQASEHFFANKVSVAVVWAA